MMSLTNDPLLKYLHIIATILTKYDFTFAWHYSGNAFYTLESVSILVWPESDGEPIGPY